MIATTFVRVVKNFTNSYCMDFDINSNFITAKFIDNNTGYVNQTATFQVTYDVTLHIWDTYIPDAFKNQGFLTALLSEINKLPGLNGNCKVHVAMNSAWPNIISRFEFNCDSSAK